MILDDPFARGINRAADQASGGLSLPLPNGEITGDAKTGSQLLGASKTKLLPLNLYRVAPLQWQVAVLQVKSMKRATKM